jgi:hypothetical protein
MGYSGTVEKQPTKGKRKMLTKEDVEILNGRGHSAASPATRLADIRDARIMRFATSHETFLEAGSRRQIALAHRMRAGIGLSPEEYATLGDVAGDSANWYR